MSSHDGRPDDELTIALAEYAEISNLRRGLNDQSGARFNFFLVVATAVAAVSAGMFSGASTSLAKLGAIGTLGALTLVMGVAIFVRLVEFSKRGMRYAAAQDALRTYLAGRAPQFSRYMLMPTLGDLGVLRTNPGFRRDAISLAGTVGLVNSMLLALAGGLLVGAGAAGWLQAVIAAVLFAGAFTGHIRYTRTAMRTCKTEIAAVLRERGLTEQPASRRNAVNDHTKFSEVDEA